MLYEHSGGPDGPRVANRPGPARDQVWSIYGRHRTVVDIRRRVEVGEVVAPGEHCVPVGEIVIDAAVNTVVVESARSRAEVVIRIAQTDASLVRRREILE